MKSFTALFVFALGFGVALSSECQVQSVQVSGTISAPTPCHLTSLCLPPGAESFLCAQVVAPLSGKLRFTSRANSNKSYLVEAQGGFSLSLPAGKYSVKFERFDGTGVNCGRQGRNFACAKVSTSSGFASADSIAVTDAVVSAKHKKISLSAQAAKCS